MARQDHRSGVRRRAEHSYQQLDVLRLMRQEVRRDLLVESKKHKAWKLLCRIPGIGPIRAALLVALIQTPHRFRTKRQLWTYSGLGLETHDSAQYRVVEGQLKRSKKWTTIRLVVSETIGAVTTAKWNHGGEEAYLCFARGDETRHWALGRPLSE
jgi:hypothetical protein